MGSSIASRSPRRPKPVDWLALATVGSLVTVSALFAVQPGESHSDKQIADLERALAETTDPESRASLDEKLKIARETRQQELDAKNTPVDKQKQKEKEDKLRKESEESDKTPKQYGPRTPAGDGYIVEGAVPPLSNSLFLIKNDWFIETGGKAILVAYAGAQGQNHEQGEVIVMDEGPAGFKLVGRYPTPGRHGAVRVVGASGRVLELQAEDGATFMFDMETKAYQ